MQDYTRMFAGMDIGDRYSEICILDAQGEIVEQRRVASTESSLIKYFSPKLPITVAMETGFHSPWMSRALSALGAEVVVANARKVALIAKNNTKSDKVDAELLARLARSDLKLLSPVTHRSKTHHDHLGVVRARDALVRTRTMLVNHIRMAVKTTGERLPTKSAGSFHKLLDAIPAEMKTALAPLMTTLETTSKQIDALEKEIARMADELYPATAQLREIHGVGPITALAFVLAIGDPTRFRRNRDIGSYLGMVPRKRQSGGIDPHLRITKAGNVYLRSLLIIAANRILGPFGPDCDLRRHGLEISTRGGKLAKKKAVVAVARKLAVLMLSLWKNGEVYEPLRQSSSIAVSTAVAQ
jgi:transposase